MFLEGRIATMKLIIPCPCQANLSAG